MLGCGLRPNTSMHGVEELTQPWYLLKKEPTMFRLVDETGAETVKEYWCHNFHASKAIQRYDRLANLMEIPCGKVLNADCYLIDAVQMWQTGNRMLEENPNYFIDIRE